MTVTSIKPEYKKRAGRDTHTAQSIDRTVFSSYVIKLLAELEGLDQIAPRDGVQYSDNRTSYKMDDDSLIRLTEKQLNLAQISSEGYGLSKYKMLHIAGYSIYSVFVKKGNWNNTKQIRQELTSKYDYYNVEVVQAMTNHLRYNSAVELKLDAKWLLAEQVDLYSECRRKNLHTQAVRLLHDISYHIDIDARVSNKLEIESTVDYAALLQQADARIIDITPSPVLLPALEDTVEVEGTK